MFYRITSWPVLIFLLKCYSCMVIEETVTPITFQNVKINLISQKFRTNTTLLVPAAENIRNFIIGQNIDTLHINNQVIPTLYENSVKDIRNIAVFDFSSNQIQGIEEGAFGNLGLVQALNLSANLIRVIRSEVFTNIDVRFLFLAQNRIFKIEDGAFSNLPYLYLIDLSYNRIMNWNWQWFEGSQVKSINMRYNLLDELPEDAFRFLDELKIPDQQRILHHLHFDHNEIRTINRLSLPRLKKLFFFNLSHNKLISIEKGTFNSVEFLGNLDLSYNYLTYLDHNLFKYTRVGYLNLKANYLYFVNFHFSYVINLDLNPLSKEGMTDWLEWKKSKGSLLESPEYS